MISMHEMLRAKLGTVAIISLLCWQAMGIAIAQQHSDPRQAMVNALSASSPHPSLGDEARVFDRFVGTWDCAYTFFLDDGSIRRALGELEFGWVLDGQAMQDIWITYPKEAGKERSIGTSVRFFDQKTKLWRVIFVSPSYGAFISVRGRAEGERIVLRGVDDEGAMLRWSFNDFKADSFIWRGETSRDGGKSWRLEEEHRMKRRIGNAPANDPSADMIRNLRASGPHPGLGAQAQIFDRFVGTWELDGESYNAKGEATKFSGEWIFGWALDGKVVQDVLLQRYEGARVARGTTLRFYDAKSAQWRIVWISPWSGNVLALKGGASGERILLEGLDVGGERLRWSFNEIRRDSFHWRGESSIDGGQTWRLEQAMRLTRRSSTAKQSLGK
jgi:hypothetical protein